MGAASSAEVLATGSAWRLTGRAATVEVDGGELRIEWDEATDHVFMTGPVEVERTGTLAL